MQPPPSKRSRFSPRPAWIFFAVSDEPVSATTVTRGSVPSEAMPPPKPSTFWTYAGSAPAAIIIRIMVVLVSPAKGCPL